MNSCFFYNIRKFSFKISPGEINGAPTNKVKKTSDAVLPAVISFFFVFLLQLLKNKKLPQEEILRDR